MLACSSEAVKGWEKGLKEGSGLSIPFCVGCGIAGEGICWELAMGVEGCEGFLIAETEEMGVLGCTGD